MIGETMIWTRLTWGVKASFRAYVEAAGGTINVSDGATRDTEGAVVFPAVPGGDLAIPDEGPPTGAARFQGAVTLEAHGGMLRATLAELGVEATQDGLVLTAAQATGGAGRCAIARLGPVEVTAQGAIVLGAVITLDGMFQIADNYPPGTPLDPVRLD
jgi:hypothetical protein